MAEVKNLLVKLTVWVAAFLCRLVIALVLLVLIVVVCLLIPFMGTRKGAHFLARAVDALTENPL